MKSGVADCSALEVVNARNRKMTVVVKTKFEERRSRAVLSVGGGQHKEQEDDSRGQDEV